MGNNFFFFQFEDDSFSANSFLEIIYFSISKLLILTLYHTLSPIIFNILSLSLSLTFYLFITASSMIHTHIIFHIFSPSPSFLSLLLTTSLTLSPSSKFYLSHTLPMPDSKHFSLPLYLTLIYSVIVLTTMNNN